MIDSTNFPNQLISPEEIQNIDCTNYLNFYKSDLFDIISDWDSKEDFIEHIESRFIKVIEHYNSDLSNKLIKPEIIEKHYNKILEIISLSMNGFHSKAFFQLEGLLEQTINLLNNIWINPIHFSTSSHGGAFRAYKIRKDEMNLMHKDFFHIPFDQRHKTINNRYSLQGLPCLYYNTSAYGCWEELNQPLLEKCSIVAADITGLQFIDLSEDSKMKSDILELLHSKKDESLSFSRYRRMLFYEFHQYLFVWPLAFASTVRKKYKDSIFHPEYILPQLLLEWVRAKQEFDGIKYLSTKKILKQENTKLKKRIINYAIPLKGIKKKGYDNILSKRISWTDPIYFTDLKSEISNNIDVLIEAESNLKSMQLVSLEDQFQ